MTRAERLALLAAASDAAHGTGHLNGRLRGEQRRIFATLAGPETRLGEYLLALKRLSLAPGWGTQVLRFHCQEAIAKLTEIEPLADLFVQDQLRGSPLLFYAHVLDGLLRDANRLAGVQHKLYGRDVGIGLNALNPGLARGFLYASPDMERLEEIRADGIYVLPETVADLPPLGGILTAGNGNPLSHVQLLARNLGIPNVAVDESLLDEVRSRDGRRVVLAVSPGGVVELAEDAASWDAVLGGGHAAADEVLIRPDVHKLDLAVRDFVPLDELRASDSGRIVGPKAAKLGELRRSFPEVVRARGVAVPFGLFREVVLDRPYGNTGRTAYEWMAARFREIGALPQDTPEREAASDNLRVHLYDFIRNADPGPGFRQKLKAAMERTFGADFRGGVFVRSDTNVEDLPGFTGAGLNLTLPHVVGLDRVAEAIAEVWASPYTARAFAWRQGHMRDPENVYPAVLLLETVPSDKSGVMVTQGLETGDRAVLSVAVNEGMGGAVEGQAAESLRIDTRDGDMSVLATATAPWRSVPRPEGGVAKARASGNETLLTPEEIRKLVQFSKDLPARFPAIVDDEGRLVAADVEFAFVKGALELLEIRPFLEARPRQRTVRMDGGLRATSTGHRCRDRLCADETAASAARCPPSRRSGRCLAYPHRAFAYRSTARRRASAACWASSLGQGSCAMRACLRARGSASPTWTCGWWTAATSSSRLPTRSSRSWWWRCSEPRPSATAWLCSTSPIPRSRATPSTGASSARTWAAWASSWWRSRSSRRSPTPGPTWKRDAGSCARPWSRPTTSPRPTTTPCASSIPPPEHWRVGRSESGTKDRSTSTSTGCCRPARTRRRAW
jgi:hypothetical protein